MLGVSNKNKDGPHFQRMYKREISNLQSLPEDITAFFFLVMSVGSGAPSVVWLT